VSRIRPVLNSVGIFGEFSCFLAYFRALLLPYRIEMLKFLLILSDTGDEFFGDGLLSLSKKEKRING
jgi:hypothetical protein